MTRLETTWDGLPIAPDDPRGAGVVVRRPGGQFLLLHRHHHGPEFEGDWAWTSPSGARLPGEPVLVGALRELEEEAGLRGVELRPVDLSGMWASFAAKVDADTAVVLDPEHDRCEWLDRDSAVARLSPPEVAALLLRGCAIALPRLDFRPLTRDDLPLMVRWQAEAHVRRFWHRPVDDIVAAEAKYGPRMDGEHPTRVDIISVDGVAAGFIQHYRTASYPGMGIGPQAIWCYLRDVVMPLHPDVPRILATPDVTNARSIRTLQKVGFRHLRDVAGDPSLEALCSLSLPTSSVSVRI